MTRRSGSGAYSMMRRFAWRGALIALPAVPLLTASVETGGNARLACAAAAIAMLSLGGREMARGDTWERPETTNAELDDKT